MPREENRELEEERKAKTAYDLVRIRLNRLEKNIEKLAPIPSRHEAPKPKAPMEFVRNVVGSSAAAGSAEFHIYRNNKRKEQERLEYIEREGIKKDLNDEFEKRKQERREVEDKRTEKKRRKRQMRKERIKSKKAKKNGGDSHSSSEQSDSSEDEGANKEQNGCSKDSTVEKTDPI